MRKLQRITTLLQIEPGANVLEIGCGWGSWQSVWRARARMSPASPSYPPRPNIRRNALPHAGLEERSEIALRDYRDETGLYDRVVSIEMLEAVGELPIGRPISRRCGHG